jgi:hypothetical protein
LWGITTLDGLLESRSTGDLGAAPGQAEGTAPSAPIDHPTMSPGAPADPAWLSVRTASGANYTHDTLAEIAERANGPALAPSEFGDGPLSALADNAGFGPCVTEVLSAHPGEVTVADFATYEGTPAVIFVIRLGNSTTVVAVGAQCGPGNPDILATVTVS